MALFRTSRTRRGGGLPPHVVTLTRDAVRDEVREAAESAGMTFDEFVRRAEADDLEDDRLRDLWMMAEPALR